MYDQESDTSAPYDNVEFPVRNPGTGTWPGPSVSTAGACGAKISGHQTASRSTVPGSKLTPLVEVDYCEGGENINLQTVSLGNTSPSPSTPASSSQQQQQQQSKANTQTVATTSNRATTATWSDTTKITATVDSKDQRSISSKITSPAATISSTTSATATSTSSSTASSEKQKIEMNNKPATVMANNDHNGPPPYMSTQVTPTSLPQKKTLKQVETEEEDFKRQDLNPRARLVLENVYTQHQDFYLLNTKVLEEGSLLKQDVLDIYRHSGETLTYEQLLQGMLVDGERFLLGSCWLYYTHVQFLDLEGTKVLREPYGRGRIGLTSKRVLFLSTETYTDANLEQFKQPTTHKLKAPDNCGYKLEVSKCSSTIFKNIPLSNFHSAEMEIITGTAAQTQITKRTNICSCLGIMAARWMSVPPMTRSINSRVLRVGVSMPPWQTRMFLDIHLDPSMSLTVARDFIAQLHAFAPHMH